MVRPQRVELCVEPYKDPPQNRRGQGVYMRSSTSAAGITPGVPQLY